MAPNNTDRLIELSHKAEDIEKHPEKYTLAEIQAVRDELEAMRRGTWTGPWS